MDTAAKDIRPGLWRQDEYLVGPEHSARHLGSGDLGVLATPAMILFMEVTARRLLGEHLPAGFSSVGVRVDVRHLAPCPVGARLTARAEVSETAGAQIRLDVEARDGQELLGAGSHWRVVINEERFMKRVAAKADID